MVEKVSPDEIFAALNGAFGWKFVVRRHVDSPITMLQFLDECGRQLFFDEGGGYGKNWTIGDSDQEASMEMAEILSRKGTEVVEIDSGSDETMMLEVSPGFPTDAYVTTIWTSPGFSSAEELMMKLKLKGRD